GANADHVFVAGSNAVVLGMPMSEPWCPPMTIARPSLRNVCPAQKSADIGTGTLVKACVAGFQSRPDGVSGSSHASHMTTFPVGTRAAWTATSGQFITGDH